MSWELSFISEKDFTNHVKDTIDKYGEKLESFDIVRFNKNIVDPIKMIFDKTVYQTSWDEIVGNEIFRQRDKSNNNDIGYFHQRVFQYINNCHNQEDTVTQIFDYYIQKILWHLYLLHTLKPALLLCLLVLHHCNLGLKNQILYPHIQLY